MRPGDIIVSLGAGWGIPHYMKHIAAAKRPGLLQEQGDLAAARPLFERALAISEKVLGPEHPDTANKLNNLAGLLWDKGDLAAARPLYERALAICEKVLGPEHPNTNRTRSNFAGLLLAAGAQTEAFALGEKALANHDKAFPPTRSTRLAARRRRRRCESDMGSRVVMSLSPHEPLHAGRSLCSAKSNNNGGL